MWRHRDKGPVNPGDGTPAGQAALCGALGFIQGILIGHVSFGFRGVLVKTLFSKAYNFCCMGENAFQAQGIM